MRGSMPKPGPQGPCSPVPGPPVPLSAHDKAARLAVLAGGTEALYRRALQALHGGDPQWAAVLAEHLLKLEPERLDYHLLKGDALRAIGDRAYSAAGWSDAARRVEDVVGRGAKGRPGGKPGAEGV